MLSCAAQVLNRFVPDIASQYCAIQATATNLRLTFSLSNIHKQLKNRST